MASEQDIWELIVKTIGQEKLKELETGLVDVSKAAGQVEESGEKAAKSTVNVGRAALEGSRALEDLQYGIGGVLNNIPGLVTMLGGPAGLAAAISLTAVGLTQLVKHWDEIAGAFQTKNPFPEMTGDLHELEAAIKGNAKELDELREKHDLTNDQLARANQLIKERADLEAQQEQAALMKKIRETEGADVKARGEPFEKMVAQVGGPQAIADVAKAFSAKYGGFGGPEYARKAAEAIIANATKGRPAARDELEELLATGPGRVSKTGVALMGPAEAIERMPGEMTPDERKALQKRKDERAKEEEKQAVAKQKAADKAVDTWHQEFDQSIMDQKKATTATARAFEVKQQLAVKANKPFLEQESRIIKQGGFAEQAEAMLAQGQAGGVSPEKRFAFVQQQAAMELKQRFPRMDPTQRADMATRITAMGKKQLDQRMLDLQAQGVNANQRTQEAMEGALQAVQRIANNMGRQNAHAGQLQRGFRQVQNHMAEMQPGAGNVGP